jgi:hypothetical protein
VAELREFRGGREVPGEEETDMTKTREQDVVVVEEAELLTPEEVTAVLEALLAEVIKE